MVCRLSLSVADEPSRSATRRLTHSLLVISPLRCRFMAAAPIPLEPLRTRRVGRPCCTPRRPTVDPDRAGRLAVLAKALGDPTRLQIVDVLRQYGGRTCVCDLEPLFDISQPALSKHLKRLRDVGLIDVERRGVWAYYYVKPEALEELTAWLS
jgi:ArsR family transcriptional regulator, arsenate/arsenite/antimonite-responsive transcriptional repressor